jgi:hypothetical protein
MTDLERFTDALAAMQCDFSRDDPDAEELMAITDTAAFSATRSVVTVNRVGYHFDGAGRFLGSWNDQWPRGIVKRGRGL